MKTIRVKYYINNQYKAFKSEDIWNEVIKYISSEGLFSSVKGLKYKTEIHSDRILFFGGKDGKRKGSILRLDFIVAYESIKEYEILNTNVIDSSLTDTFKRKRSPFWGLLLSAGIISKEKKEI